MALEAAELWSEYSGAIDIENVIESMRNELSVAAQYDTMLWGEHNDPSGVERENFDAYVDFFKERLLDKILIIENDLASTDEPVELLIVPHYYTFSYTILLL